MTMLRLFLLVLLIMIILGGLPPIGIYPPTWGYYPSGFGTLLLIVLLLLILGGRV
jgi:hypothetical protein